MATYTDAVLLNILSIAEHLRNVVETLEEKMKFMRAEHDALLMELAADPEGEAALQRIMKNSRILRHAAPSAITPEIAAQFDGFLLGIKNEITHQLEKPGLEPPLPN